MNFDTLKAKVAAVKREAEILVDAVTNPQHQKTLSNFVASITNLSDFLDGAQKEGYHV